MTAGLAELLADSRDELYRAKTLVRATRNHTKVTAAALQDSEDRIDALIDTLEKLIPTPKEAQEHADEEHHPQAATLCR